MHTGCPYVLCLTHVSKVEFFYSDEMLLISQIIGISVTAGVFISFTTKHDYWSQSRSGDRIRFHMAGCHCLSRCGVTEVVLPHCDTSSLKVSISSAFSYPLSFPQICLFRVYTLTIRYSTEHA